MGHVPHLFLPAPWQGEFLPLNAEHVRHLGRVLRRATGSPVTYTDGQGHVGEGLLGDGSVVRGAESEVARHLPPVLVAVAPPNSLDRCRQVVEKLAELGVDELHWVTTRYTQGRAPKTEKAASWATASLQQSRGAWSMRLRGPRPLPELADDDVAWIIADPVVGDRSPVRLTDGAAVGVVVGPEGGWADEERSIFAHGIRLGSTTLRTETAALVGATRCLELAGRL